MRSHAHEHRNRMVLVGQHAAWYDRLTTVALRPFYRAVARHVLGALPEGGRMLDVGTGPGQLLVELGRRRADVALAGIDPSADMVGHATRRVHAAGLADRTDLQVAGAEDLPFAEASFDAVVSTLSSHHWADPVAAVAEQARVLRPGGQLWIFDLRTLAPKTLPTTLQANFSTVTHPHVGPIARALFVCHSARTADR
jgi:ubiquinone/menaquinone biosynthesis C-methylase UbiE